MRLGWGMFLFQWLFALTVIFPNAVFAEVKLSERMTYAEFGALVKHSVAKIPELQNLWRWTGTGDGQQSVYFGGGTLRGLLHWIYLKSQNHTYNQIWNMQVPSVHQLQLQEGSDLDLFALDTKVETIKQQLPEYANWDILPASFHKANVELGGPTIEKAQVNPDHINDPLGGLLHYYEGRLVYHWTPEGIFRQNIWVGEKGNTKTTEALRFMRFSMNLPELTIDEASLKAIHDIAAVEGEKISRSEKTDFWIQKGLKKLHISTGKNVVKTLLLLKKAGLLPILARFKYAIPGVTGEPAYLVPELHKSGFTVGELKYVEKMMVKTSDGSIRFMNAVLPYIKNPEEFLITTMFRKANPDPGYQQMRNDWILKNLGKFLYHGPSLEQLNRLRRHFLNSGPTHSQSTRIKTELDKRCRFKEVAER